MQVDGEQAVDAGARDHVGNQLGGDRHSHRSRAAILPRVAEVRHDRRDPGSGGAPAGVHHHQQLHDVFVARRARGLHDEHIAAAHVFHQLDRDLTVAEAPDRRPAQRHRQMTRDLVGKRQIRIARKHRHGGAIHWETPDRKN